MQTRLGFVPVRLLGGAAVLLGATLLMAVGCGGSSGGGDAPAAGAGGDAGDTASGGKAEGGKAGAGKGGAPGKGGATSTGGEAGDTGEGGEAGGGDLPPAQNASAVSFMSAGAISKSKNFVLISGLGESLGGTVGSKRAKSLKYTYIPGVIAASSN